MMRRPLTRASQVATSFSRPILTALRILALGALIVAIVGTAILPLLYGNPTTLDTVSALIPVVFLLPGLAVMAKRLGMSSAGSSCWSAWALASRPVWRQPSPPDGSRGLPGP